MVKQKIITALIALTLSSAMGGNMEKFDWLASESAPEDFTMQIVKGDFSYPDGGSLYVPNMKTIHNGWGEYFSSHLVGPDQKPLPNRLDITFFSYSEDTFYQGSFDLPYDKISSLFDKGYISPRTNEQITYRKIVAGVAPGGVVSVWLNGQDRRTEVFFGHAEKVELPWVVITKNKNIPREEYILRRINETQPPETIERIKQNGIPFGIWDRYHKRYQWQLDITGIGRPVIIERMEFYNGEIDYRMFPIDASVQKQDKAIPNYIGYIWMSPEGQAYTIRYRFNEAEMLSVFDELAPGDGEIIDTELRLEIQIEDRKDEGRVTFTRLHNNQKSIKLQKTAIDISKTSRWSEFY